MNFSAGLFYLCKDEILLDMFLQGKQETNAFSFLALGRNLSFVEKDGILNDRKTQSGSSQFAATAFIDPIEAFEDAVDMFFFHSDTVVREVEIIEFLVLFITGQTDGNILAGIGDGIIKQIPEDRVEERMIPMNRGIRRQVDLAGNMLFFHFLSAFMLDFLYQLIDIDVGQIKHGSGFIHPVQDRNILQQNRQSGTLRITALDEELPFVGGQVRIVDDCFQISLNTADRRFQFVRDVLRQLPFHPAFFLLAGNIIDRDFITVVEEHHTFNQENLSALVDGYRFPKHPFMIGAFVFFQEIADRREFFQVQYLFSRMNRIIRDEIGKLDVQDVRQDFLSVVGKHGESFP